MFRRKKVASSRPISLPAPSQKGILSVEEAISQRRSVRSFRSAPLTLPEISQVLWAAQGLTGKGFRASPSAGATYPLEVFVFVGPAGAEGMDAGIYRYNPRDHKLSLHRAGDHRRELSQAALNQRFVAEAPVDILIAAVYHRTSLVYGHRAGRYVSMEVGHAGQNIYLQAEALDLGTVAIGAFDDERVAQVLSAEKEITPLYIMPVGRFA